MKGLFTIFVAMVFVTVMPGSSQTAGAVFLYDDFETGLDTNTWYLETINGAQWQHTTLGENGCIVSNVPSPVERGNRMLDVLTQHDNFGDITATWDMLFTNESYHRDMRSVYFRGDNSPNVHGYWIHIGVGRPYPYDPSDQLAIGRRNADGSFEWLTAVIEYPWQLNQWHSFRLQAVGNEFKLRVWEKGDPEPVGWTLEATDNVLGAYATGRFGFGNYWLAQTYVDNVNIIPEPSTLIIWSLLGALGITVGWYRRRKAV